MPSRMFPLVEYNPSSSAMKLFQAVRAGDFFTSKAITTRHPQAMLELLEIKHRDGSESLISALQYACFSYNTVICNMFFETIKNNANLKERFITQVHEQESHLDLTPLFLAYDIFLQAYSAYASQTENITTSPFQAWHEIGVWQRKVLQTYMLQEFILMRNGSTHTAEITFEIYDLKTRDYVKLSPNALYQKNAALIYTKTNHMDEPSGTLSLCYEMPMLGKILGVKTDLATWRELYQKQLRDYASFLASIQQTQAPIPKEEKRSSWCTIS